MTDEEALAQLRRAVADDPLNAWVGGMHSFGLSIAGRHAEGILEGERSLELDPESFFARWSLMRSFAWAGQYDRVIEMAPAILLESGRHVWALGLLAWTWAQAGHMDRARACAEELEARSRHEFVSAAWLSVAVAAAGRTEEGFGHFERAVAEREPTALWSRRFVIFSPLRAHPRYEEVTRPLYG